jgi:hypothetical protein
MFNAIENILVEPFGDKVMINNQAPTTQKLILKDGVEEYEIYVTPTEMREAVEDELGYRGGLTTVDLEKVHHTIQGYAKYAIGAFRHLGGAEVSKVTLKFNLKLSGKAGIPMLTQGSAESNFEIQLECTFPKPSPDHSDMT